MQVTVTNPIPHSSRDLAQSIEGTVTDFAPLLIIAGVLYGAFKIGAAEIPSIEASISNKLTGPTTSSSITSQNSTGLAGNIISAVNPTMPTVPPSGTTNTTTNAPYDANTPAGYSPSNCPGWFRPLTAAEVATDPRLKLGMTVEQQRVAYYGGWGGWITAFASPTQACAS